jgi:hypothetical protein
MRITVCPGKGWLSFTNILEYEKVGWNSTVYIQCKSFLNNTFDSFTPVWLLRLSEWRRVSEGCLEKEFLLSLFSCHPPLWLLMKR